MMLFLARLPRQLLIVFACVWLAVSAVGGVAFAQQDQPSSDASGVRAALDRARAQLEQIEATLQRPDLRDSALQQLRIGVDPQLESLRKMVEEATPRVETLKARLAQLGPRPAANAAPESADVARDRADREKAHRDAEDTLQLARALVVQAEQVATDITDRRRSQFARQLFERSQSPLSPFLWWQVSQGAPRDFDALMLTLSDWWRVIADGIGYARWIFVLLGLAGALAILGPVTRFIERYTMRQDDKTAHGRGEKAFRGGVVALLGGLRPIAAAYVFHWGLDTAGLLPQRISPVVFAILAVLAFVSAIQAVAQGVLAPDAPGWRLPTLSDANAATLKSVITRSVAIVMVGKLVETVNQAIGAGLALTIATRSIFALLFVAMMWRALSASRPSDPAEEACLGPYVPPPVTLSGPARILLATALIVILAATATGYVPLAVFLVDQVVWIGVLGAGLYLLLICVENFTESLLAENRPLFRLLSESIGLRRRSVEQFAVIATALGKVFLCFTAILLAIAPWGVESTDIISSLRSAVFGFKIGDVTISFSSIVLALIVFALGVFLTKSSQTWLEEKFLPRTDLDSGLKDSIRTILGYVGFVAAAALAFSSLGLSLDRVAIIAGALSVGIGFGLQSIVNNFVSGLILLWERPIRVGDLIDVGGDQGVVRRINVRSTEIETGDRSTVIMPNSNLVSGVVKNRVHNDRSGRILIPLTVTRAFDPDVVAAILYEAANTHEKVLKRPEPCVFFKKISETMLDFELVCFVGDVDVIGNVSSDLHFIIFRAVSKAQPTPVTPTMNINGLHDLANSLERIVEAVPRASESSSRFAKIK
ncbi:DUF3772 domain-containing protein [Terrarubrum flagellatum]|uniref:DUF3772 domain-containing protein n=1 Tax=Terrirubrum flagellatum TaxID=2895980 RepID=UPI003144E942